MLTNYISPLNLRTSVIDEYAQFLQDKEVYFMS